MTRINVGVKPKELTNKHLIAEHREIKRIPNTIKSGKAKVSNIPDKFKLGTGHVKFFYNKILYLKNRYKEIYDECISRGFKVTNYESAFSDIDSKYMGDYKPTDADREIVLDRIKSRLSSKSKNEK